MENEFDINQMENELAMYNNYVDGAEEFNGNYVQQPNGSYQQNVHRNTSHQNEQESREMSEHEKSYQLRNRHRLEKVKKKIEAEKMKECTFKPKINKNSAMYVEQRRLSTRERIELLSQPKDLTLRYRLKKEVENEKLSECTFRPNLSSTKLVSTKVNTNELTDRLLHSHDDRSAKREMQKRMMELQDVEKFQFQPKVRQTPVMKSVERDYVPVHQRIGELQKQKHKMLQSLRQKKNQEWENYSYNPQLGEKSEKLAAKNKKPFLNRLDEASKQKKVEKPREEFTFKPKLNKKTKKLLQNAPLYSKKTDFLTRQEMLIQKQQYLRQMKEKQTKNFTFQPKIGQNSKLIVESKMEHKESLRERVDRMTYEDKKRQQELKNMIEQSHYSKYSFKPKMNEISRAIAQPSSIDSLVSVERKQKILREIKDREEKRLQKECTFQPNLPAKEKSTKLAQHSKYRNREAIQEEKENKIQEARRLQQFNELKGCTFQPQTHKTKRYKPKNEPILINGLGKYLQRADRAKQLKEEFEERERKAFNIHGSGQKNDSDLPYTIPEPFQLHHNALLQEQRRREIEEKWRKVEMEKCTFQPKFRNHDIVNFLLEEF